MNLLIQLASKITLTLPILFGSASAFAGASIKGYEMQHCTASKVCLRLKGVEADQSSYANLWVIPKSELVISDESKNKELQRWSGKTVFFNDTSKQLVVKDPANSKEWQINLEDLKVTEFKL
ncbi:hypothetical protein [Bdellovibrio sp. HCB2-146]|uniref:hypothetical protein n=1 Tax=Bdellovibrio sp. HCB2-146 TaxID=3394362 RepID=UPI0039BC4C24